MSRAIQGSISKSISASFYLEFLLELLGAALGRGGGGWRFIFGFTPPAPPVEELTAEPEPVTLARV